MPKITLDDAKLHLRVDANDEDSLIASWILAAYLAIEGKIFRKVVEALPAEGSTDVEADAAINAAALLIVGHLNENRGDASVRIPSAADWLLLPYVNFAGGS